MATRSEHVRLRRRKSNAKPHWYGHHTADDFPAIECLGSFDVKDCFFSSVGERLKAFDRS